MESSYTNVISVVLTFHPKTATTGTGTNPDIEIPIPDNEVYVHFIDVGQGDSILIDFGDTEILIDGG